jgi:hypothetical protein
MNTDKILAEKIASEYVKKETSKITALKKLDAKAKQGAQIFAYTFGIIMSLVFGTGMCLAMKEISLFAGYDMLVGVILGLIGIAGMSVNYYIYKKILNYGKQKYGNDIILLAKEIADEQ